jgi:thioredoxin 1
MQPISHKLAAVIIVVLVTIPCLAQDNDSNSVKTIEQLYPNLAAGVLMYAKVGVLPEGILLKADGIEIAEKDIDNSIQQQPEQFRQELKKNAFFVLEQESTGRLLLKIANDKLGKQSKDVNTIPDSNIINALFENITKDVNVNERDVETFYKENESIFCGTPLDKVRKEIESYVLQDKKQRFMDQYIQNLGQKMEILVSDSWTKQQAANAKDNPLDKARAAGKPMLAIFSASSCCGPDKMIPVKEALLKKYDTKINIIYIEPRKEQILAARYGIRSIPTQVFYDSKGKEFFRHSGFFSEKDITSKLSEMGVQ